MTLFVAMNKEFDSPNLDLIGGKRLKKLGILTTVVALAMMLVLAPAVIAQPRSVTIGWLEDATRYNPDGSVSSTWTNDGPFSASLVQTGNAYHFSNVQDFYNTTLGDLSGNIVISGGGKLSGHTTYTSLYSGLPIKERLTGTVTVNPSAGTMVGTYTQYGYAFGPRASVLSYYPSAIPAAKQGSGWWLIAYTTYTAHQ